MGKREEIREKREIVYSAHHDIYRVSGGPYDGVRTERAHLKIDVVGGIKAHDT